jgi:MFS family permease
VFGALGCTFLGDLLGRRKTIFIASVVQGIGAILQASAFAFGHFVVGLVDLGLGTGGIIATVSVWQAEVSKAENRGEHVSAWGIFCGLGLSVCALGRPWNVLHRAQLCLLALYLGYLSFPLDLGLFVYLPTAREPSLVMQNEPLG